MVFTEDFFAIAPEGQLVVVAGPNGAGKTYFIKKLLDKNPHAAYQNPDKIEMPDKNEIGLNLRPQDIGRIVLTKIRQDFFPIKKSIIYETTISGNDNIIKEAAQKGYKITCVYNWLGSPEHSVKRVNNRVKDNNGHDVPCNIILRHYFRSIVNLSSLLPLCKQWTIYDVAANESIAWGNGNQEIAVNNEPLYKLWETNRIDMIEQHKSDLGWAPSVLASRIKLVYSDILFKRCYSD